MSNKQNHIRQLLKRWISGDINAADEQRLDNAAKEDQFLGEALSGLRSTTEKDHAQSIARLRKQLKLGEKKKGLVYMPMLRIAAAVALLIVAGWLVWTGPQLTSSSDLAMNKTAEPVAEKAISMDAEVASQTETEDVTSNPANDLRPKPVRTADKPLQSKRGNEKVEQLEEPVFAPPPLPSITDDIILEESEAAVLKDEMEATIPRAEAKAAAEKLRSELGLLGNGQGSSGRSNQNDDPGKIIEETKEDDNLPIVEDARGNINSETRTMTTNMGFPVAKEGFRVIEGTITDSEGYPLIGANVLEKGTANGAIADIDGFFTITVPNRVNVQLICSYTGYETMLVSLDKEITYPIALSEGMALSEVVVTNLNRRSSKKVNQNTVEVDNAFFDQLIEVQPVLGFKSLKDYIRQNTPINAGRGKIRLRFTVNSDGRPIDITVLHSTNQALDALAIQLIAIGPNWIIINGEAPVEVEYRVKIK